MLATLVTVAHVLVCMFLVGVILVQQGRGADAGATFGGGSNTLFGASGADTLLVKVTTIAAAIFMMTSIFLALHQNRRAASEGNLFQNERRTPATAPTPADVPAPSATAPAASPAPAASTPAASTPAPAAEPAPAQSSSSSAPAPAPAASSPETVPAPQQNPAPAGQ